MNTETILVRYVRPPIPLRSFDWSAVRDNYEPGLPVGYGNTPQEALEDLLSQEEE
jgi:hypothetical protein